MVIFYKIWKNTNEIQLTKNKMDLNNRIMKNNPPYLETEEWIHGKKYSEQEKTLVPMA